MKIEFISYPYVFAAGKRIHKADIAEGGNLHIGAELEEITDGKYQIVNGAIVDPDCVGGVCPIK